LSSPGEFTAAKEGQNGVMKPGTPVRKIAAAKVMPADQKPQ
jgi:hypothetical protein